MINYRVRILAINYFDLLGSSNIQVTPTPVSTLPYSNLQLEEKSKIMRVNSNTVTIRCHLDTLLSVNCIYLHECTANSYVSYKVYNDMYTTIVAQGNMLLSSNVITNWKPAFALANFDPVIAKSIEITMSGGSYIDCGRLFIGNAINPLVNFAYSWSLNLVDQSIQERTESGVLHTQSKQTFRKITFSLDELEQEEINSILNNLMYCGTKKQVLICLFPTGDSETILNTTILGKFTEGEFSFTQNNFRSFSSSYTLEEGYTSGIGSTSSVIFLQDQVIASEATISSQQEVIDALTAENISLNSRVNDLSKQVLDYETRVSSLELCCTEAKSNITSIKSSISNMSKDIAILLTP